MSQNLVFVYHSVRTRRISGYHRGMYDAQTCCLCRELRNSLVWSVMNLNENLIFMRMTSECNSSEVWKDAIVLYFEWILADIMSFVMRWDTKQNEPIVSLNLFVFVWMKVNCFSEYFWRFSVLLFHPLCAPDGYELDKTLRKQLRCFALTWPNWIGWFFTFALVPDVPV